MFLYIRKANQIMLILFSVFFFGLIQWFTLSDAPIWQTPLLSLLALALVASRFHLTVLVYLLTFTYCENLDICTNTLSAPGSGKKLLSFNVNFSTLRFHWAKWPSDTLRFYFMSISQKGNLTITFSNEACWNKLTICLMYKVDF